MLQFLQGFLLKEGEEDKWRWKGSRKGVYSVKNAYKQIEKRKSDAAAVRVQGRKFDDIWRSVAPFKAQMTSWRLALDRLPTKENLAKRNVITYQSASCCGCNRSLATSNHLFLGCPEIAKIWDKMIEWIGVCWAMPREIENHRVVFSNLLGDGTLERRLGGLWTCVIWVIWKLRNSIVFESLD